MATANKSRILIIGATGYFGKHLAQASASFGHPTTILVRESTLKDPNKADLLELFKSTGISIIPGSIDDHESLVNAIKSVDVVICAVGSFQVAEQRRLIHAVKEAGNVKRYFPSEFGVDIDRVNAVEPAKTIFSSKSQLRRDIESEGIPYTFVCCNFFTGFFIPVLGQAGVTATVRDKVFVPPKDKVVILGDGNAKVVYVNEADVALYTIKAVDDPRTLNKILYMRPPANTLSTNELVALWENKIGKTLDKVYLPEEKVLKTIAETPFPGNVLLSISHVGYVRGDQTNFEIGPNGVEATQLYPEVIYGTVDEFLNKFV